MKNHAKTQTKTPLRHIVRFDVVGLLAYIETELLKGQDLYDSLAGTTPHSDPNGKARMLGTADGYSQSRRVVIALRKAILRSRATET